MYPTQSQGQFGGPPVYPAERRGCWGRNWKWLVPTGCFGLLVLFVAAGAAVFFFVVSAVKSSEVYRRAFEKASSDQAVIAELGQPVGDGWLVVGSIETNRSGSGARFHFPISGPKNSGTVYVVALKARELYGDDEWHFETLEVEVKGQPGRINLIEDAGDKGADVNAPPPPPAPTPAGSSSSRAPVSGGVLNDKAVSKPEPAYPPIAKAARAQGTVTVQVIVDESGNVVSATAVSGHPLLQQAAAAAARQAKFAPLKLGGQPVKFTGVLTYNFVLE